MKYLGITLLILGLMGDDDSFLLSASDAFKAGKYEESILYYKEALEDHPSKRFEIYYNLAQAFVQLDSLKKSTNHFFQARFARDKKIAAQSSNNLGVNYAREKKITSALAAFKMALELDPQNNFARYNLELLYRIIDKALSKEEKNDQTQAQDPSNTTMDSKNDRFDQDGGENNVVNDKKSSLSLEGFNYGIRAYRYIPRELGQRASGDTLSVEEAVKLIELLKQEEIKYLQQLRRKAQNLPTDTRRPNW